MPLFSKRKGKDKTLAGRNKLEADHANGQTIIAAKPKFVSTWTSKEIDPEEVQELIHACTQEMKTRAEALDAPFFLLPFRPDTDSGPARAFIQNFYKANQEGSLSYTRHNLRKELVLTDPSVICSILKWCWSRIPGGVVSWPTYEGFRLGEQDSNLDRHAFDTFIPLCVDSPARKSIIVDFFDLLASVAAHGKSNGLGGRKLSRMAAWWAFAHADEGKGFEGGYKSWAAAADASSHLFFAYLRSLEPEVLDGFTGINALPRSLKALLAQTEYPPDTPTLMQTRTPKVIMLVDSVSSGPFALLRRAKHFEYRDEDLQMFSEYNDPVQALTPECRRVLASITAANDSSNLDRSTSSGNELAIAGLGDKPDESWSRFQDFGFSDFSQPATEPSRNGASSPTSLSAEGLRSAPRSRANNRGRPTTPSWADFLNSGFVDESHEPAATLLLPSEKILPPLGDKLHKSSSAMTSDDLGPGELASIIHFDLDETFWWVWITSLANEEPAERKAAFGRCAMVETGIMGGRWLVIEEQVKGASPEPEGDVYIAEKKSRFGFSRRNKMNKRRSTSTPQKVPAPESPAPRTEEVPSPSKAAISPDQQAKIKAAAAALNRHNQQDFEQKVRRGRADETTSQKTNSVMTLGLTSEAGPAMKWAKEFDREAVRRKYLGDDFAGKGGEKSDGGHNGAPNGTGNAAPAPVLSHQTQPAADRDLPPTPPNEEELVPTKTNVPTGKQPAHESSAQNARLGAAQTPEQSPKESFSEALALPEKIPIPQTSAPQTVPPGVHPTAPKIERKPVGSAAPRFNNIHEHPAFRKKENAQPNATTAAQKAWNTKTVNFDPQVQTSEPAQPKKGGFRSFFGGGKKKETPGRKSFESSPSMASLAPPSDSSVARKFSLRRRKDPTAQPRAVSPVPPKTAASAVSAADTVTPTQPTYPSAMHDVAGVDTEDSSDAEHAFARFDQGPLDAPAFVPRESMDSYDSVASSHGVDPDHLGGPGGFPETPMETPMETTNAHDAVSEASVEVPKQTLSHDRWAQIKKNAAERQARMSEDQISSRPTGSVFTEKTEDDGETSGEETIEARVARIRARVAELTGNTDSVPLKA